MRTYATGVRVDEGNRPPGSSLTLRANVQGATIKAGRVIGEYVGELKREGQIQAETSFLGEDSAFGDHTPTALRDSMRAFGCCCVEVVRAAAWLRIPGRASGYRGLASVAQACSHQTCYASFSQACRGCGQIWCGDLLACLAPQNCSTTSP